MKIKQIVEEIKSKMPENLSQVEVLRYIYIYLGKIKSFDPVYYFGNSRVKDKICRLSEKSIQDRNYLAKKKNLVCITAASLLRTVANEFNINITSHKDDYYERYSHIYNTAKLDDGRLIKLDLQLDLKNIQSGRRTKFFGRDDFQFDAISEDEIEKIDQKIGYCNYLKEYTDDDMKRLAEIVKDMNNVDAIQYILSNKLTLETISKTGYVEGYKYLRDLFEICGKMRKNKLKVSLSHCYREKELDESGIPVRQYSICVRLQDENLDKLYLYKRKKSKFEEVSNERMARLMGQGLKFYRRPEYSFNRFMKENSNWENIWNR